MLVSSCMFKLVSDKRECRGNFYVFKQRLLQDIDKDQICMAESAMCVQVWQRSAVCFQAVGRNCVAIRATVSGVQYNQFLQFMSFKTESKFEYTILSLQQRL